jgi:hypothetical protein
MEVTNLPLILVVADTRLSDSACKKEKNNIKRNKQAMKELTFRQISLLFLVFIGLWSCNSDEKITMDQEVVFSTANLISDGIEDGRMTASTRPKSVLVTIKDNSGNIILDRKELALHKFGDKFLSIPITLKVNGANPYLLTEFLVVDEEVDVIFVTPREGSAQAQLVSDPLDIEFFVSRDAITTVIPEVLAVDESSNPADYGYGQFGFEIVKTIDAIFSAFIKGEDNFELTDAHLKIEGLSASTAKDTTVIWAYETDLKARANIITVKEATSYKITASKPGYETWQKSTTLDQQSTFEIVLDRADTLVDVYVAGHEKNENGIFVAKYWKNGVAVELSDGIKNNYANSIFVSNNDVYVAGYEDSETLQTGKAKYWKNGMPFYLSGEGSNIYSDANGITVSGNDVYVAGIMYSIHKFQDPKPVYWKNGSVIPISEEIGNAYDISVLNNDVYVGGSMIHGAYRGFYAKNGNIVQLKTVADTVSYVYALTTYNGDVYTSGTFWAKDGQGQYFNRALYWKNEEAFHTNELLNSSFAFAIDVLDDNIYIAGRENVGGESIGKYWKNGENISLENDQVTFRYMEAVEVFRDQVYLGGSATEFGYPAKAYLWLNGTAIKLGNRESSATSIFLKER